MSTINNIAQTDHDYYDPYTFKLEAVQDHTTCILRPDFSQKKGAYACICQILSGKFCQRPTKIASYRHGGRARDRWILSDSKLFLSIIYTVVLLYY